MIVAYLRLQLKPKIYAYTAARGSPVLLGSNLIHSVSPTLLMFGILTAIFTKKLHIYIVHDVHTTCLHSVPDIYYVGYVMSLDIHGWNICSINILFTCVVGFKMSNFTLTTVGSKSPDRRSNGPDRAPVRGLTSTAGTHSEVKPARLC